MKVDRRARLAARFRRQEAFSRGYSPLYARLFGLVALWLETTADPLADWLVIAAAGRQTLDVTLLLAAGLHREILAGHPEAAPLAPYYPSVGGEQSPADPAFAQKLRQAIWDCRDRLASFIQTATVQTNETGRGLCWTLPLLATGQGRWTVVDLGASAGLNLVADRRAYRLLDDESGAVLADVGTAPEPQFSVACAGELSPMSGLGDSRLPSVVRRIGCDLRPFHIRSPSDRLTLMAFVWGDQVSRLERLREGLAAFEAVQSSSVPVSLFAARLPEQLGQFLYRHIRANAAHPLLIYNTWITAYLDDKGSTLRRRLSVWADRQRRPVLWLQWEPPRDGRKPPDEGYCLWTADLWQERSHHYWELAWVHPHGQVVKFLPDLAGWLDYWQAEKRAV